MHISHHYKFLFCQKITLLFNLVQTFTKLWLLDINQLLGFSTSWCRYRTKQAVIKKSWVWHLFDTRASKYMCTCFSLLIWGERQQRYCGTRAHQIQWRASYVTLTGAHFQETWGVFWIDFRLLTNYRCRSDRLVSPGKSLSPRTRSAAPVLWNLHPDNHTAGHSNWVTLLSMPCFSTQQ